jgi:hypothetical protein
MYPHPCFGQWKKRDFGEVVTCLWCLEETDRNIFNIPLDQGYHSASSKYVGHRIEFCSWHCRQQWLKFFKKSFPHVWKIFKETFPAHFQTPLEQMIEEDGEGAKSIIVVRTSKPKYYMSKLPCGGKGTS